LAALSFSQARIAIRERDLARQRLEQSQTFRGLAAIKAWSEKEIFIPLVTLEVIGVVVHGEETILTTKVDGNFDRTGLPDPVIINAAIQADGGRIVSLTCRLAGEGIEV
jgi:hypothetical protein